MDDSQYEVRISDPGEVAAAVPHLIGFRPEESVVVIGLGGGSGGRVGLVVRADIPPPEHAVPLAGVLARGIATDEPAGVVVAVVTEAGDEPATPAGVDLPHRPLVHTLVATFAAAGIPVRDVLLVRAGRWWSYDCPDPCCVPGAGTPLPTGVSALAAASVAAGQVVARDRAELEARIEPSGDRWAPDMSAALLKVTTECSIRMLELGEDAVADESWAAVRDAAVSLRPGAGPGRLTDLEVVRLCWGLRATSVRDRALGLAVSEHAAGAEALWTELTRRAPAPLDVAPATLLAVSAWLRGDGAMANVALGCALDGDEDYRLARLLREALDQCVRPEAIRAVITASAQRPAVPTDAADRVDRGQRS